MSSNHFEVEGGQCEYRVLSSQPPIRRFTCYNVQSQDLFREPSSVYQVPPALPGLPATVSHLDGYWSERWKPLLEIVPPSLTLLPTLLSSLTPSTLRTVRPIPPPTVRRWRSDPSRFPCGSVGQSSSCTSRWSSWLPYTYSRVIPYPVSPAGRSESMLRAVLRGNTHKVTIAITWATQNYFLLLLELGWIC